MFLQNKMFLSWFWEPWKNLASSWFESYVTLNDIRYHFLQFYRSKLTHLGSKRNFVLAVCYFSLLFGGLSFSSCYLRAYYKLKENMELLPIHCHNAFKLRENEEESIFPHVERFPIPHLQGKLYHVNAKTPMWIQSSDLPYVTFLQCLWSLIINSF